MTDVELLQAERDARMRAWDAPRSIEGNFNDAYARLGAEWCELHRECRRRGLRASTDDPGFRPQQRDDDAGVNISDATANTTKP